MDAVAHMTFLVRCCEALVSGGGMVMKRLIDVLPDVAWKVMDRCIVKSKDLSPLHPDYEITYWFGVLELPPDDPFAYSGKLPYSCLRSCTVSWHRLTVSLSHLFRFLLQQTAKGSLVLE